GTAPARIALRPARAHTAYTHPPGKTLVSNPTDTKSDRRRSDSGLTQRLRGTVILYRSIPKRNGIALSRDAIEHRLAHHVALARAACPSLQKKQITMHTLRHTT